MENREITIEELQIGDEILTLTQQPKYLKVLELPIKSKVPYKWRQGIDRYIAVKCRVNVDITSRQGTKYCYKTKGTVPYTYYNKEKQKYTKNIKTNIQNDRHTLKNNT
jgi:hypothetical protein